ncbi:MAG: hypothetical protein Q9219_006525 [cf. Caloplaca sp. 3 TL-2023]
MFLTFSLIGLFLASAVNAQGTQQAPETCSLASFDRCGPAKQLPGTPSTCNATVALTGTASVYGVRCFSTQAIESGIVADNCVQAVGDICNKITDPHVLKNRWIWSNQAIIGCTMGFWLPSGNGTDAAFAPDYNRCMYGIFQPMSKICTNPSWNNLGGVNLKIFPNTTTTGEAVDSYYPSYVIAPSQLTGPGTASEPLVVGAEGELSSEGFALNGRTGGGGRKGRRTQTW